MNEYAVIIQYDKNDNIYVAKVPDLPGCMVHGETQEQAIKEIQVAIKLWIEVALEVGKEVPEPIQYVI